MSDMVFIGALLPVMGRTWSFFLLKPEWSRSGMFLVRFVLNSYHETSCVILPVISSMRFDVGDCNIPRCG